MTFDIAIHLTSYHHSKHLIKILNISITSQNFFKPGSFHPCHQPNLQKTIAGEFELCRILYDWNYITYITLFSSFRIMMLRFIQGMAYVTGLFLSLLNSFAILYKYLNNPDFKNIISWYCGLMKAYPWKFISVDL